MEKIEGRNIEEELAKAHKEIYRLEEILEEEGGWKCVACHKWQSPEHEPEAADEEGDDACFECVEKARFNSLSEAEKKLMASETEKIRLENIIQDHLGGWICGNCGGTQASDNPSIHFEDEEVCNDCAVVLLAEDARAPAHPEEDEDLFV